MAWARKVRVSLYPQPARFQSAHDGSKQRQFPAASLSANDRTGTLDEPANQSIIRTGTYWGRLTRNIIFHSFYIINANGDAHIR